jgi:hypothetical protein
LDSNSLKLYDLDENVLAKFNRKGVYFYDVNGLEMACFTNEIARVGNITIEADSIHSINFVSGALGSGFKINDLGNAELNNAIIRGKITSSTFVSENISAVGGSLLVMDSDVLSEDMSTNDNSTLTISGDTNFYVGDILRIKIGTEDEWFEVVSINGNTYTINRDKGNQYSSNNNPEWKKGSTIVNYGQSGSGGLFMTSSEDDSPYLDILTHSGSPWSTISTKVRLGNLEGITDGDFGGSLSGYGLYADNVYLKGKMIITGGNASVTFYQNNEPGGSGDTNVPKNGDYWIDTNDSNKLYTYQNGWIEITSSGGITTFRQSGVPTSLNVGDLWIDTDDNKLYRATNVGDTTIASGHWELQDAAIATGWAHSLNTTKIDGGDIYTGTIVADAIAANTITADKMNVTQLDALTVNTGSLNVDETITVGSAGKVVIDGANECILVYDASDNLMIKLGKLS